MGLQFTMCRLITLWLFFNSTQPLSFMAVNTFHTHINFLRLYQYVSCLQCVRDNKIRNKTTVIFLEKKTKRTEREYKVTKKNW